MIGRTLSHYQILERIGSGGMGEVYRAWDEHLEREVALKILPSGAVSDEGARRRFRSEALALSRLSHPNIATIHEFDSQDGIDFLVLELVPGVTLSDRIGQGPTPEADTARIGEQLAEGLAAAHGERVLHRDIKPSNLRLTPTGLLKILDFGLATVVRPLGDRSTSETVTAEGVVVGTLPYMSPEQLRGEQLDPRTDIYSAGAALYELACARKAFPETASTALISAILSRPPTPPRTINQTISPDLEAILLRCLEKVPEKRYGTALDLARDLRRLSSPSSNRHRTGAAPGWGLSRRLVMGVAAGLLVAAVGLVTNAGGIRSRVLRVPAVRSLAVLPLANLSGDPDQEYFADGMTDELITRLAQVGSLRVISRSSIMEYKSRSKSLQQIASELNVEMVIEGSILRSGDRVRVSAKLVGAAGHLVWAEQYERPAGDALALQSDLAKAIVQGVQARVTSSERRRLAAARVINPEAHRLYLRGRHLMSQWKPGALQCFEKSLELDPGFAPTWAGLADHYIGLSSVVLPPAEAMPRARAAALKSLELDTHLAAAHASLAAIEAFYDWNWKKAEAGFRRAIDLNPSEPSAHHNYGFLLVAQRRFKDAEAEMQRAVDIDPLSTVSRFRALWPLYEGRRYDQVIEAGRKLQEAQPDFGLTALIVGQAYVAKGDYARGLAQLKAFDDPEQNPLLLAWVGYAHGRAGDKARAVQVLRTLEARADSEFVQPYALAVVSIGLDRQEEALQWLEKAVELRTDEVILAAVDPAMDPLRSEARFKGILRRMGLPSR